MYNAEIKQKYLEQLKTGNQGRLNASYEATFNQSEAYEKQADKDLGELHKDIIVSYLNNASFINYQTAYARAMTVNRYRSWYSHETGFPDCDWRPIDVQQDIDFVTACKTKLYTSFDEILEDLRAVDYDFLRGDEAAPAICLAWLGFKVPEILSLKNDCVNLQKGFITDETGAIIVKDMPADILQVLRDYKSVKESYRILNGKQHVRQLDTGYFIHKMVRRNSTRGGKVLSGQLYDRLDDVKRQYEVQFGEGSCKLSPLENVWTSGCFHRLYQLEKNGLDIYDKSNFPVLQRVLQGAENKMYGTRYVYTQYKKAFNLE